MSMRLDDPELEQLARLSTPLDRIDPADQPGMIAITADEAGRYTRFAISIQGLVAPAGSRTGWQISNDIAGNRNAACEAMLADETLGWLWFIDDDHAFKGDILVRLLNRRVDVVTPICLRRQQPFLPVATVADDFMALRAYGQNDLVQVQHAGSSGMLIRRQVLEAVEPPWFELGNGISEDVNFCRKATAADYEIYVDMGTRLGHITTAVVWPAWDMNEDWPDDPGQWVIGFEVADGAQLKIPPTNPDGTAQ